MSAEERSLAGMLLGLDARNRPNVGRLVMLG